MALGRATMALGRANALIADKNLVWVDLEMSGLDIESHVILEMACIITDGDLNVIDQSPDICINYPESVLTSMAPWPQEHHDKSGLTQSCRESTITLADAEKQMIEFLEKHVPKGKCPLAGNSVHCDRMFLNKYMPQFTSYLHYRIVDVSSIKELCRRWYPRDAQRVPAKKLAHRALDDILESIEELKYYRSSIFKK